jgi:hypothetical protein
VVAEIPARRDVVRLREGGAYRGPEVAAVGAFRHTAAHAGLKTVIEP